MPGNVLTGIVRITAPGVEETFRRVGNSLNIVSIGAGKTGLAFTNLAQKVAFFGGGVNRVMPQTIAAINRLPLAVAAASSGYSKFTQTTNAATAASINLGRVIQDAPFGFLGIANNLNPLLESFQRLRAQSASSGEAFKKLGASMLGAGGLGLAISILSTGLILFGDKLFGAGKKAKEAKEDVERLNQVLKDLGGTIDERKQITIAGTSDETARVDALAAAVLNQTKSYTERNNALNQLKDINKSYFGDLTLEEGKLVLLRKRVEEYSSAIIAAATVRAFADDIGKVNVELSKQSIIYSKIGNTLDENKRKLATTSQFYTSMTGEERAGSAEWVNLNNAISKGTRELKKQEGVINELADKSNDFRGALGRAVEESLKFKPLTEAKVDATGATKTIDDIVARAKRISDAFKGVIDIQFETNFFDTEAQIKQKAAEFLEKFNKREFSIDITPELKADDAKNRLDLILKTFGDVKLKFTPEIDITGPPPEIIPEKDIRTDAERLANMFGKTFTDTLGALKSDFSLDIAVANDARIQEQAKKIADSFNQFFQSAISGSFENIGEVIGEAISGGDITKAFEAFGQTIGSALQAVGKQIIAIGVAAILAKEALKKLFINPFIAVAAGVALIAAGAAFKNVLGGGLKTRAKGGPVDQGETYLVGEKGPELFTPRQSGKIIPHQKTKSILAGTSDMLKSAGRILGGSVVAGTRYLVGEGGSELFRPNTGQRIQSQNNYTGGGVSQGGITVKIVGQFVQRGQDMVATIALANQSNNRLT